MRGGVRGIFAFAALTLRRFADGAMWRTGRGASRLPAVPLLLAALLAGCGASQEAIPKIAFTPSDKAASAAAGLPHDVVVGVDDMLEVTYLKRYPVDPGGYRFDVGDSFQVQFFTSTETPQDYTVQPDGRIYLPEIGSLMVRGLTAAEIASRISERYKKTRLAGPVNVVARTTDAKVNELLTALGRSTNGQSKSVRVLPDGTVSLPLIDVVVVAGSTLGEVQSMLNERYGLLFDDLHVSVALQEATSRRFAVLGEVATPGLYPIQGSTSILDALAKAGGVKDTGASLDVVLLRPTPTGVQSEEIDLDSDEHKIGRLAAVQIEPRDIVFVPRSRISSIDRFVEQYIRDILPFSTSLGYAWTSVLSNP